MPVLRRTPPWGSDTVLVGIVPIVSDPPGPFDYLQRGGWVISRMSGGLKWQDAPRYQYPFYTGAASWKRLSGVAQDPSAVPIAGASCWAYRKDDDVSNSRYRYAQEGSIGLSDVAGNYEVMVPTDDQYGLVFYKAGTPDLAGTTVNTLVGS